MAELKKESANLNDQIVKELKASGLKLSKAIFHNTVESHPLNKNDYSPEYALYAVTTKKERKADMWYTPTGLLIEQPGGRKLIPLAQVKDTDLL